MPEKLIQVGRVKPGEFIKWDHLKWCRVLDIGHHLNTKPVRLPDDWGGNWTYIKLEGFPKVCTIWHDVELPWRTS